MSKLIILSGIPGAGKTYYANDIRKKIESVNIKVAIISSDVVRSDIAGTAQNLNHESEVWQEFELRIKDAASIYDVIIADSTAATNKIRMKWFNCFKSFFDKIELHWFNIPFDICWERNKSRSIPVPLNAVAGLYRAYQEPDYNILHFFDEIVCIGE